MGILEDREREQVAAVAALTNCNPFVPQRVALEQELLGTDFIPIGNVWYADGDAGVFDPNLPRLRQCIEELAACVRQRLTAGAAATSEELANYRDLVLYLLWLRFEDLWLALIHACEQDPNAHRQVRCYDDFVADAAHFLAPLPPPRPDPAHLFALGFQTRRAFYHIFRKIFGASRPAAQLRATVWESIFTDDAAFYRDELCGKLADIPTLITGESGTGKELVARAIARSQFIPFDAITRSFAAPPHAGFCPVNLAALNPGVIESELFGHRRGSFTGAAEDHSGWFERCGAFGSVFLDEIGELDAAIQVKLLRVLQNREFQRLGDTESHRFEGKIIAATHRDLCAGIRAGRFREDFYYRLCADSIQMPTLREQLADKPDELASLVAILARRFTSAEGSRRLTEKVIAWISTHMPPDYPWPGNTRELEQCVRNVLVHGRYQPPALGRGGAAGLGDSLRGCALTAEQLVERYALILYEDNQSFHETARRMGVNWRTIRKLVQPEGTNGDRA